MNRAVPAIVLAVLLGLIGVGCGVHTAHKSISAAPVAGGTGWKGGPIRVEKGDKVVIKVGNQTKVTHGFSIDAFGIKQTVDPAKHVDAKLTPTRTGRFVIYCQLHPAHKKTELIVT